MKKILVITLVLTLIATILTGCNKMLFDTVYSFDTAIISLPNGKIIEGKIDSWTDYEDGDQIQVKINGITYLVHSSNITLISRGK